MNPTALTEMVDRVFGNRYRIEEVIGVGTVSAVFRAFDSVDERWVALKRFDDALGTDPAFVTRLLGAAEAASALQHPNIAHIIDWGDQDGPYIVSELCEGGSLAALLAAGHRLSPSQALVMALECARALQFGHERGVAHQDLRPANLLFTDDQRLRISDFGLASVLHDAPVSQRDSALDNVRYVSPEQARGRPVGPPTDLYSLAMIVNEAVTGEAPEIADTVVGTLMARAESAAVVSDQLKSLQAPLERAGRIDAAQRPEADELTIAFLAAAETMSRPAALPLVGLLRSDDYDMPIGDLGSGLLDSDLLDADLGGSPPSADREAPDSTTVDSTTVDSTTVDSTTVGGSTPDLTPTATVENLDDHDDLAELAELDELGELGELDSGNDHDAFDELATLDDLDDFDVDALGPLDDFDDFGDNPEDGSEQGKSLSLASGDSASDVAVPPTIGGLENLAEAEAVFAEVPDLDDAPALDVPERAGTGRSANASYIEVDDDADERLPWWPVLLLVVLVGGAIAAAVYFTTSLGTDSATLVPNLVGTQAEDLDDTISGRGWTVERRESRVDGSEAGTIISQAPEPGTEFDEGEPLVVTISLGNEMVEIPPDVVGLTVEQAASRLGSVGLTVGDISDENSEIFAAGIVVEIDEPTTQKPSGEQVDLRISLGPESRTLPPSVIGMSIAEATGLLTGLRLQAVEEPLFDPDIPAGTVMDSLPQPGQEVPADSQVTLFVSAGPAPVVMPELIGLSLEEAIDRLDELGLVFIDSTGTIGEDAIGSLPPAGATVDVGTEVTIILDDPPEEEDE